MLRRRRLGRTSCFVVCLTRPDQVWVVFGGLAAARVGPVFFVLWLWCEVVKYVGCGVVHAVGNSSAVLCPRVCDQICGPHAWGISW